MGTVEKEKPTKTIGIGSGMKVLNLKAARFIFTMTVQEPMILPPYKGSTFRGGFGNAFRRIACSRRRQDCDGCLLTAACPYWLLFEPGPPAGTEILKKFEEIPRPFVIEPDETEKTEFQPGEVLSLHLVLIGKALDYLPYFILVFKELGEIGIGKGRAGYRLDRVTSIPLQEEKETITVYDGKKVYPHYHVVTPDGIRETLPGKTCDILKIDFKTMTRLKAGGVFVEKPEFSVLVRVLFRRLSLLQYFYCGERMSIDFNAAIERAQNVSLRANTTSWVDWERYSSRQNTRMKLGGLVGRAEYEGPWHEFSELLRWGELVHVGKGATFGLGRYELVW